MTREFGAAPDDVASLPQVIDAWGTLDVLVNNAGQNSEV